MMRTEGRLFKNFRTQLTPLAESPLVSNVRRIGASINPHKSASGLDMRKVSSGKQPAQKRLSQQQRLFLERITHELSATGSPLASLYEPQLTPNEGVNNKNYILASSVISELCWLAASEVSFFAQTRSDHIS